METDDEAAALEEEVLSQQLNLGIEVQRPQCAFSLVDAWDQPRRMAHIISIGGKFVGEDALLVIHAGKLRSNREGDNQQRPGLSEFERPAEDDKEFSEIKRMADEAIRTVGNEASRLRQDAEKAPQPEHRVDRPDDPDNAQRG
jgi:hypothetical protein